MSNQNQRDVLEAPVEYVERSNHKPIHDYRTNFQRDRDRILYSRSFRRLSGKTQVFIPLSHDHVRNRLTHTLEVSQIARITARNLQLNETLSEAMALGHDLGHTPFGHVGERALNLIMNNCGNFSEAQNYLDLNDKGFKHNHQSVRACCDLEKIYPRIHGMNLTNFTLWGIRNHSGIKWKKCDFFRDNHCYLKLKTSDQCINSGNLAVDFYHKYDKYLKTNLNKEACSFEAYVVAFADEIAQRHHDVEDAYFMKILDRSDILGRIRGIFKDLLYEEDKKNFDEVAGRKNTKYFIPLISRFLVHLYNHHLIDFSKERLQNFRNEYDIKTNSDFSNIYPKISHLTNGIIDFTEELKTADKKFKEFLMNAVLNSFYAQRMDGKGLYVIKRLFKAYLTNPKQLHDATIVYVYNLYRNKNENLLDVSNVRLGQYRENIGKASMRNDRKFQRALIRAICDHIAGMTDAFVINEYERLYGSTLNL